MSRARAQPGPGKGGGAESDIGSAPRGAAELAVVPARLEALQPPNGPLALVECGRFVSSSP